MNGVRAFLLAAALLSAAGCAFTVEWGVRVPRDESGDKPVRYVPAGDAISAGSGVGVYSGGPTGTWMGIGTRPEKIGPRRR